MNMWTANPGAGQQKALSDIAFKKKLARVRARMQEAANQRAKLIKGE